MFKGSGFNRIAVSGAWKALVLPASSGFTGYVG